MMSILGACLVRGPRRRVWVALAVGQMLYLAGDVLWVIYEQVLHIAPYPSLADAFYLARYVLLTIGLMWLIRGRHARPRPSSLPRRRDHQYWVRRARRCVRRRAGRCERWGVPAQPGRGRRLPG